MAKSGIPRAVLSKIHVAKQQVGMDDDSYRLMLKRVAGVHSSKELDPHQADAVLAEFERLGFTPRGAGKPHNFASPAMPAMITKVEAQLADMSLPWSYADSIARRMFGVQRVSWVRQPQQLRAIIAALHVEQQRRQQLAAVEELMTRLTALRPDWRIDTERLPAGWKRDLPTLRSLGARLAAAVAAAAPEDVL